MHNFRANIIALLRWSERYTKIDMLYFVQGGFWVGLGQFSINALSLILIYVFANYLPKEVYGIYQYAIAIIAILSIFSLTGMNRAVARSVAQGEDGVLRTTVRYQLKWSIPMWVATGAACAYYYLQGDPQLAAVLAIIGFFSPITSAFLTYGAYLEGRRKFNLNTIFGIATTLFYIAGMAIAVLWGGTLIWLAAAYALTSFAAAALFYFLTTHLFKPPTTEAPDTINYGWKLTAIGSMAPIVNQIDKIIVASVWGAADLAVYALALVVPNKLVTSIKTWVGIGFPKLANRSPAELDTTFYRRIFQGMLIGGGVMIVYIVLSPLLFTYLLPQYIDSIFYSQILSLSLLFAIPNRYISLLFESQKLSRLIFINSSLTSTIKLTLFAGFGFVGGITGLAIAHVAYNSIGLIINIVMWRNFRRV